MSTRKPLTLALATALGAVSLGSILAMPVYAQDQAQEAEDELLVEEVIVTGSRIVRKELVSAQPVEVLDSAAIDATGLNNVGDILMNITASDGTGLRPITTATNGSDGSQEISLRNLGADRTLILVDGRRWVTDIDQTVDLNTIPTAMIERIEVLKNGASAIYGSDAIAGVINVITKKDFEGVEFNVYYGQTAEGDGDQENYSLTMGANGERSNAVFSISYTAQEAIFAGDRKISYYPYFGCEDPPQSLLCGSSYPDYGRYFDLNLTLTPGRPGTSPDDFEPWSNAARYNFAPVNYLQQPIERYNLFASAQMDLTDDIELYGKMTYVKRKSVQQLAQVPMTVGVSGPQWDWRPGANVTADNVFNPFGVDIAQWGLRAVAIGPRQPNYDYDTFGFNVGVRGSFEFADRNFNWDVGGQYNDGQYDSVGHNYVNLFNLANATGPSFRDADGILRCGTPGNVLRGCTPFNIFGGPDLGLAAGVITQDEYDAMVNYVGYTQSSTAGNTTDNFYADLSGDLFNLPGGMAAFAVGVEYRKDTAFNQPDSLVAGGGSSDNFQEPTKGWTKAEEMYLEINLPLLSDVVGAQDLTVQAAVRYSDYSGEGNVGNDLIPADIGSETTPSVGITWRPIEDLMFRANWGETFRAPSVSDLYGGGGESFPSVVDPCNTNNWENLSADAMTRCMADNVPTGGVEQPTSQLRTLVGGNPYLKPEFGESMTLGFVYTPSYLENLEVIVDYWDINLEDAQSTFGASYILNQCYLSGVEGFCNFVERTGAGGVETVRTAAFNANERQVSGVDWSVRYLFDTDNFGTFRFAWDNTWTFEDKTRTGADDDWNDMVGIYQGETNWEYRSNFTTNWIWGNFNTTWTIRYVSELEEDCWIHYYGIGDIDPDSPTYNPIMCNAPTKTNIYDDIGVNYLKDRFYHDLQVAWATPWEGGMITVGGRNIFGEEPPLTQNSFAHSFDGAYDLPQGGFWYAQYRHHFR
jgi:iron complex outermembrane receptor protein